MHASLAGAEDSFDSHELASGVENIVVATAAESANETKALSDSSTGVQSLGSGMKMAALQRAAGVTLGGGSLGRPDLMSETATKFAAREVTNVVQCSCCCSGHRC